MRVEKNMVAIQFEYVNKTQTNEFNGFVLFFFLSSLLCCACSCCVTQPKCTLFVRLCEYFVSIYIYIYSHFTL